MVFLGNIFNSTDFPHFEWNMIIDKERIGRNLREVEIYMFDDAQIKEQIFVLRQDLQNDHTIMQASIDELDNPYPVIKNRFDDVDIEAIPHHWQNISPLLYHLFIW